MKPKSYADLMREQRPLEHGRHVTDRDSHVERRLDPVQAEADRLRSSGRWKRLRAVKLGHDPLCEDCLAEGRTTEASDVDHRIPVRELVETNQCERVFDMTLLHALCRPHHNVRTARETNQRRDSSRRPANVQGSATRCNDENAPGRPLIATQSEDGEGTSPGRREANDPRGEPSVSVHLPPASASEGFSHNARVSIFFHRPPRTALP